MCYLQWRTLSARATSVKRVADYKRHHSTLVYLVCRWIWRIFMTITTTDTYDIKIIPNCFWSLISSEPVIWLPPRRPDSKRFQITDVVKNTGRIYWCITSISPCLPSHSHPICLSLRGFEFRPAYGNHMSTRSWLRHTGLLTAFRTLHSSQYILRHQE